MDNIDSQNMSVEIDSENVIIKIPIDLMIWAQEHRDDPIYVNNRSEMLERIKTDLLEYGGDPEIGATAFELFMDNFFTDRLEWADDWLHGWWENEYNENNVD